MYLFVFPYNQRAKESQNPQIDGPVSTSKARIVKLVYQWRATREVGQIWQMLPLLKQPAVKPQVRHIIRLLMEISYLMLCGGSSISQLVSLSFLGATMF